MFQVCIVSNSNRTIDALFHCLYFTVLDVNVVFLLWETDATLLVLSSSFCISLSSDSVFSTGYY